MKGGAAESGIFARDVAVQPRGPAAGSAGSGIPQIGRQRFGRQPLDQVVEA
jgi:hypothetical protein